jgi:hypothetical protein
VPLYIDQPQPNWWLSPAIWVTPVGATNTAAPGVANPIAGQVYDVWVQVQNPYDGPVNDWKLFVCWAIPTAGPIPLPPNAQFLNNAALGNVAANSVQVVKTATTWQPAYLNGGHECLVAVAYADAIGGPPASLNGDAVPDQALSIAQHNLGVLAVGSQIRNGPRIRYAFQVCNGADEEGDFVVTARQAPLEEIAAFLPGVPGGRKVIDRPGKVERLCVAGSAHPDAAEIDAATEVLSHVKIARRSCRAFTLGGELHSGNALIHVTQSLGKRVVGGLSVLVMAEEK